MAVVAHCWTGAVHRQMYKFQGIAWQQQRMQLVDVNLKRIGTIHIFVTNMHVATEH